jgi:hypothetical protein
MQSLIAAGQRPDAEDFKPTTPIGLVAQDAWRWIESKMPEITFIRDDLWTSRSDESVVRRLRSCLQRLFGDQERWTLMHHGFYFYTPPQWALFRLLRESGLADQWFMVHDDGQSQVFEIWRRFFSERLGMPTPNPSDVYGSRPFTPQASAFLSGWQGRRVDGDTAKDRLRMVRYRSPAEFVSDLRIEIADAEPGPAPMVFAAGQGEIERLLERLSPDIGAGSSSLAQLPIGAFLIRLHESIQATDGSAAEAQVILTDEGVRDIALSGFLPTVPAGEAVERMRSVLQRARMFFAGCRLSSEWVVRAEALERIVIDQIAPLGDRGVGTDDHLRIRQSVGNPLRLAPWADIAAAEAKWLKEVLKEIVGTIEELASREQITLNTHTDFLSRQIQRGLEGLNEFERKKVNEMVEGLAMAGPDSIDVTGLIDVVRILLGRDASSEEDLSSGSDPRIKPLRSLDCLGLRPSSGHIHVANLADGIFPSSVPAVGWPFRREDLCGSSIARQILETRASSAVLGDLYLLWLALDGVSDAARITLSWMEEVAGEDLNPAAVLSMLSVPKLQSKGVLDRIGGVKASPASQIGDGMPVRELVACNSTLISKAELGSALQNLPAEVVASLRACPRRFALQWLFGPTHAFSADHHLVMLYGNMIGTLVRKLRFNVSKAKQTCDSLWRFVSDGERRSSELKSRVSPTRQGPRPEWILTLSGNKDGTDPLSLAYRHAKDRAIIDPATILEPSSLFLPLPISGEDGNRGEVCKSCPVKERCREARWTRDEQI